MHVTIEHLDKQDSQPLNNGNSPLESKHDLFSFGDISCDHIEIHEGRSKKTVMR